MTRYYYSTPVSSFLQQTFEEINGQLLKSEKQEALLLDQVQAWDIQIPLLQDQLVNFPDAHLLFEYTIPRMGKRIDNVLLYKGLVFLIEFKVGSDNYSVGTEQVLGYALDLKYFHEASNDKMIIPILIATDSRKLELPDSFIYEDLRIFSRIGCNGRTLGEIITRIADKYGTTSFDAEDWIYAPYKPTPTIIEAARALYAGHNVEDISRCDAKAENLNATTYTINEIIDETKRTNSKSICFVTGVPGAGKTLAGLNISIERQNFDKEEHAVFLSGNWPLVQVLQEALKRDLRERAKTQNEVPQEGQTNKTLRKLPAVKEFIQIVHHFRDEAIDNEAKGIPPIEKVVIFDEAQRAWNESMLETFMARKKNKPGYKKSEPEFLIETMNRHNDWAVLICLIGGGQEINTGEAGLVEWFNALRNPKFAHWKTYVSDKLTDYEYTRGKSEQELFSGINCKKVSALHLSVPQRSFRSEKIAELVKQLLDGDKEAAKTCMTEINIRRSNPETAYPIYLTRNITTAKHWLKNTAKAGERYGIIASSNARRLRKFGIWVDSKVDAPNWFLNDTTDVRSSNFLEETASEFDIQGLELDWAIVAWDGNFRYANNQFGYFRFVGSKWQNINKPEDKQYLKNAYRVLLTRARQGFIIFIPEGDDEDKTRSKEFYDGTYNYLKEIGIEEI